ncbi:MAG: class I SAM-dependent methyltransferase [Proteobacteria bacterium]|nr:class I SAM-dependent methyltransferase [Pseudomonadota bacterium]
MRSPQIVPPPVETGSTVPDDETIERWALAYLRHAPLSLTLREINRLIAVESIRTGKGPVLDVGCGDGFWWTLRYGGGRDVYGIDISAREVAQAKLRITAELTDVSDVVPFPATKFEEIIGNCSLEHVPDIDGALSNLRKAASASGRLVMFVPTPRWAYQGRLQSWLLKKAPRIAMTVSGAMNGFFQHWHLYDEKVWTRLLAQNGWKVKAVFGLGSSRSEFLFRLFMPPAYMEFVVKKLTGFYPSKLARFIPDSLMSPAAKLVRWAVTDPLVPADSPTAYEYLIIADATELPDR